MGTIHEMVTLDEYRHVPTGALARFAERLEKVFASPSTWYRLVRIHKWRQLRQRVHPAKPKVGIRTSKVNEIWHVDTSLIRLVNGGRTPRTIDLPPLSAGRRQGELRFSWPSRMHFRPGKCSSCEPEFGTGFRKLLHYLGGGESSKDGQGFGQAVLCGLFSQSSLNDCFRFSSIGFL
jgi:hypothetical protein